MASLVSDLAVEEVLGAPGEQRSRPTRRRIAWWRAVVLLLAAAYFLLPLYAGLRFALQDANGNFSFSSVRAIAHQPGLGDAFWLSAELAALTMVLTLALMVPTTIYVHLRLPKLRPVMELVTLLPIVFPPIVLIIGVLHAFPLWLRNWQYMLALLYVVLAMPFVYRSLDAGLSAIDVKTLVEATRSLGARGPTTLWRVLLPNLTSAMVSAVILTLALVFGEYTMAALAQWSTFPVWLYDFFQTDGHVTVAVSMAALLATWVLLSSIVLLDLGRSRRQANRRRS